jgi:nitrate/TMAO reductase-like tetraheme cytochrome c subunit
MGRRLAAKNRAGQKMTFDEVNVLGNLINTTYGKQSSPTGEYSIKCDLAGDTMTLKYTTLVHFASERGLRDQVIRCSEEAHQRLNDYLAKVKSDFREAAGSTLKTTEAGMADNVELIQSTTNSPRKIAYYRMNHTLKLG